MSIGFFRCYKGYKVFVFFASFAVSFVFLFLTLYVTGFSGAVVAEGSIFVQPPGAPNITLANSTYNEFEEIIWGEL